MNEPLNNSFSETAFSGKSHNNHPQWNNQPLRLTDDQLKNPLLVINDFFECYHLQDFREISWGWLKAVITSPSCISSDPLERGNHLYFYEKIEEFIEAVYVLKTKLEKEINDKRVTIID